VKSLLQLFLWGAAYSSGVANFVFNFELTLLSANITSITIPIKPNDSRKSVYSTKSVDQLSPIKIYPVELLLLLFNWDVTPNFLSKGNNHPEKNSS
jgi:hypothetical protein